MDRPQALQTFFDAAFAAFDGQATDSRSRASVLKLFERLAVPGEIRSDPGKRPAVCGQFLNDALEIDSEAPALRSLVARFRAIEPMLEWKCRPTHVGSASPNFPDGHANALIVGPGGLENRADAWIGLTLMAPHVRYPDHNHAPEETYLVLSEGEFQHGGSAWFSPGVGGSFYNPPDIRHAMRSGEKPLLAFWALLPERARH